MNSSQMILDFESLPENKRIVLLCSLSLRLTVLARIYGADIVDKEDLIGKLLGINEIQHKILGYLGYIMSSSESYCSVENFILSIRALSEDKLIAVDFGNAWHFAMRTAGLEH